MEFSEKKIHTNISKEELESELMKVALSDEEYGIVNKLYNGQDHRITFTPNEWKYILSNSYEQGDSEAAKKSKFATTCLNAMTSKHMELIMKFILDRLVVPDIYIQCDRPSLGSADKPAVYADVELVSNIPADIMDAIEYMATLKDEVACSVTDDEWKQYIDCNRRVRNITTNMREDQVESPEFKEGLLSNEEYSILHKHFAVQKRRSERIKLMDRTLKVLPNVDDIDESYREILEKLRVSYYSMPEDEQQEVHYKYKLLDAVAKLVDEDIMEDIDPSDIEQRDPEHEFFNEKELRVLFSNNLFEDQTYYCDMAGMYTELMDRSEILERLVVYLCNCYTYFDIDIEYNDEYMEMPADTPAEEEWLPITLIVNEMKSYLAEDVWFFLKRLSLEDYKDYDDENPDKGPLLN